MKLRIDQSLYYAHKEDFKSLYKKLGLKWTEETDYGDGWVSLDWERRLIKLKPDMGFKRFYATDVDELVGFLKGIGATEELENEIEDIKNKKVDMALSEWVEANRDNLVIRGISVETAKKFKRRELESLVI